MEISGVVKKIIFESSDSLFKVIIVKTDNDRLTVTGDLMTIQEGLSYKFIGEYKNHARFGLQFQVTSYIELNPESEEALITYLSGPLFSGIGKKTAEKIVETLGIDAIKKIKEDETALDNISGLSKMKAKELREEIRSNSYIEEIFIKLYEFGLSRNAAKKIYVKYGDETLNKLKNNPYILLYDVEGFGFDKCDSLAINLGFKEDSSLRIVECLHYVLYELCKKLGYTYLNIDQLLSQTINKLNERSTIDFSNHDFNNDIINLISSNLVYKLDDKIFPKKLYLAEFNSAKRLNEISSFPSNYKTSVDKALKKAIDTLDFDLTLEQEEAIKISLSNKISIITGGPGTGKTTILKCLLLAYSKIIKKDIYTDSFKSHVLLISPTGKASKRLSIQTSLEAKTIHKALEYDEVGTFNKNKDNQLSEDLIIIDESSMIDVELLSHLLDSIRNSAQIVFVGDVDQLPSVSEGNVLADLINSNKFKVSYLTKILRQKGDSKIIELAQSIKTNNLDLNIFDNKEELFFYETQESNILNLIIRIVEKYINNGNDIFNDLQILVPMYKGNCGINNINKAIQEKFNKSTVSVKYGDKLFKVNDKVLNLTNKPELKIMNGDQGIIKGITKVDNKYVLHIEFDSNIIEYPYDELDSLTLGYAISIHKSQGSEFKNVIIPISYYFSSMLKKKLVYTAVTRAKEKLILVGSSNVFINSLYQEEVTRQTNLSNFINPNTLNTEVNEFEEDSNIINNQIIIDDPISAFNFIGETNMEGVNPYNFMDNNYND